jgi:hypothetical protein
LVIVGSAVSLEAIPGEGRTSDWWLRVVLINMVQRVRGRKGKIIPLRAMKTWGTGGIAPIILSPDTRWKRLISFTLKRLMYCRLRVILTGYGFGQPMAVM